jgi:hypothetical protein
MVTGHLIRTRSLEPLILRLAGAVYYAGAEGVSSFLIATPAGSILLNGGLSETVPKLEKNMAA